MNRHLVITRKTHFASESAVWFPACAGSGCGLLQHLVDLFEGESLGLWDEEVGEGEGDDTETAPHEEDLGSQVGVAFAGADEVRCDNSNNTVPEPVGCGGETNTTRSDGEREDFSDNDPSGWSPGGGEHSDVDADKGNHCGYGRVVVVRDLASCNTDDSDDELRDNHTSSTVNEDSTTAQSFNDIESNWGSKHVDQGSNQRDQEGVLNRSQGCEENVSEVKDEVLVFRLGQEV
jgi:hypothetical protein